MNICVMFPMELFSANVKVYKRRHKSALFLTQFCSLWIIVYLHSDISYKFNGENDNFVLECQVS